MEHNPARLASVRAKTEHRTFAATVGSDTAFAWGLIVATLALSWLGTYATGGSKTAVPHAFYVPVIIAAVRFGNRGALVAACVAGIVAGPLTPLDVAAGTAQTPANWATRLAIFVLIGQMAALLVRHSLVSIRGEIAARRLCSDLATAVEKDQLRLEYQPIIDLRAGTIVGAEALVRWDHPERGRIPPGEFIAQAEQAGCIHLLTRWVIDHACTQLAQWHRGLLADRQSFKLAVNLSARDLADPGLVEHLEQVIDQTGIPPHWLWLEVTETALVQDIETAIAGLAALGATGVRVDIDDFGAGESSLGQLGRLPVHGIKLDRSFLQEIERQEHGPVLFGGIIALAHAMDITTVAEGVETLVQAEIVRHSGCDMAQGYLYAKPLSVESLTRVLGEQPPAAWKLGPNPASSWWHYSDLTQEP